MRLTLRTLLAWMDDTLPPARVREIGNQVSESTFAQELVERIRRVCRQRRLTIPRSSGPEAVDPNLVAAYLDNDLDADQVADFETQCLNHDVRLAEVASVHQILSLLGQRAKVPDEVKERMYLLVKGREAIRSNHRPPTADSPRRTVKKHWIQREKIARSKRDRFVLAAGSLASIVVLCISTWYGLSAPRSGVELGAPPALDQARLDAPTVDEFEGGPAAAVAAADKDSTDQFKAMVVPERPGGVSDAGAGGAPVLKQPADAAPTPGKSDVPDARAAAAAPPAAPPQLPPGAVGTTRKENNVLLRFNDDLRRWERMNAAEPLNPSDRLVCLAPFRAEIDLASTGLTMLGGCEIRLTALTPTGQSRLQPRNGRFKAVKSARGGALALDVGARETVNLSLESTNTVGVERLARRAHGGPPSAKAFWAIYCLEGTLTIAQGADEKSFNAPAVVVVDSSGVLEQRTDETPPAWVGSIDQAPADREIQSQFLSAFHDDRPILSDVVTATDDAREPIRRLAVSALTTLGDLSYVLPLLDRRDSRAIRKDAIAALRAYLSLGADASHQAREQIAEEFGETTGPVVEKLLIGYTSKEAADPAVLQQLVGLLSPDTPSVGVRELSLENLSKITGRDDLGYDPERPEGAGLANWTKLLAEGKLVPRPEPSTEK